MQLFPKNIDLIIDFLLEHIVLLVLIGRWLLILLCFLNVPHSH